MGVIYKVVLLYPKLICAVMTLKFRQEAPRSQNKRELDAVKLKSRSHIPISVNKYSFENGIHHIFNLILIFLKLEDKYKQLNTYEQAKQFFLSINL